MEIGGQPWFAGKDVAMVLKYANPQKAIRDHIDEEDKTVNDSFTVNGTKVILINESGLYSLIMSSKLPTAKQFKRWNGMYPFASGSTVSADTTISCSLLEQ